MRKDLYNRVLLEIKNQNLEEKVKIFNNDLLQADISEATIITLYLTTSGNIKLKPKLSGETKVGTRVVSHDFDISGWSYSKKQNFNGHTIYLYTIPKALKRKNKRKRLSFFSFKRIR